MVQIQNLGENAHQKTTVALADGSVVVFTLNFMPTAQRWAFDMEYDGKTYACLGLAVHPNLLRGFRDTLPFGLACASTDGVDPFDIRDFSSGRIILSVLDSTNGGTEVEAVEGDFFSN